MTTPDDSRSRMARLPAECDGVRRVGTGGRVPQEPRDDARGVRCVVRRVHHRLPGEKSLTHPAASMN